MRGYQVESVLRKLAPYDLAYEGEELGFVWGDRDKEVKTIGVTWRPTISVLEQCLKRATDLLIIHEPLLQERKSTVVPSSRLTYPPNQLREALLRRSGLAVLRAHSNWDDADGGNNDTLARLLEIEVQTKIPYGRVGKVSPRSLAELALHVEEKLGCNSVLIVGDPQRIVRGVAVVAGSGNSLTEMIEVSKQERADVLISGDIRDSRARFASELNIALIDAGGYYTETPGMKNLARLLQMELTGVTVEYFDPGPAWSVHVSPKVRA